MTHVTHHLSLLGADRDQFLSSPMYKFYKTEYRQNMHDAEYHYYKNFAIKEKKPGFIIRILDKFENFMMDFSTRDVNEFLSQSQNRFELEQREKAVMRGDFKLV